MTTRFCFSQEAPYPPTRAFQFSSEEAESLYPFVSSYVQAAHTKTICRILHNPERKAIQ